MFKVGIGSDFAVWTCSRQITPTSFATWPFPFSPDWVMLVPFRDTYHCRFVKQLGLGCVLHHDNVRLYVYKSSMLCYQNSGNVKYLPYDWVLPKLQCPPSNGRGRTLARFSCLPWTSILTLLQWGKMSKYDLHTFSSECMGQNHVTSSLGGEL